MPTDHMKQKDSLLLNIAAIVSLIIYGFLLFFTVYHQMISQNEGFFYVIVFGGILILAYVLLSLITKLMAISREDTDGFIWKFLMIVVILGLGILFFYNRLSYNSSIPAEESVIYKTASLLKKGSLSVGGMDILPQLIIKPATYVYGYLLYIVFLFTDISQEGIVILNCIFLFITAYYAYKITNVISDRICGIFAFLLAMFMPALGFSVYDYDTKLLFSGIVMVAIYSLVYANSREKQDGLSVFYSIIAILMWGICLFVEPVCVFLLILILFGIGDKKSLAFPPLLILASAIIVFLLLNGIKGFSLEQDYMEVLFGSFSRFSIKDSNNIMSDFTDKLDSYQRSITDNYYFLSKNNGSTYSAVTIAWMQLGNQLIYMFLIVLSIACTFYMIRSRNNRVVVILFSTIGAIITIFFTADNEYNSSFLLILLIICAGVSLRYMYDNHHMLADENLQALYDDIEPEKAKSEEEDIIEDVEAFLIRAKTLILVGFNEPYYAMIKEQERKAAQARTGNPINPADSVIPTIPEIPVPPVNQETPETPEKTIEYLESPLPLPPKHVPKDLDFDQKTPTKSDDDWGYDFDISDEDDFDY